MGDDESEHGKKDIAVNIAVVTGQSNHGRPDNVAKVKNMQVKKIKLKDLKEAPYNPRVITDRQLAKLERSIKEFGLVEPIVFNEKTGFVVGGNQRLKVLLKLYGPETEVPVACVKLDVNKEKALNAALNRISGSWDIDRLSTLLDDIGKTDLHLTGFESHEVKNLLDTVGSDTPELTRENIESANLDKLEANMQRPGFDDIVDKFERQQPGTKKNENWFYVEYYGSQKEFDDLMQIVKLSSNQTKHELDPAWFALLVKERNAREEAAK